MRISAAVLVLAMLLSPMAMVVCELRCSQPSSPLMSAHASCHESGAATRDRLQSQPRHCNDRHADGDVAGVQAGAYSTRDLQAVYAATTIATLQSSSSILILRIPAGTASVVRSPASSPPLRI